MDWREMQELQRQEAEKLRSQSDRYRKYFVTASEEEMLEARIQSVYSSLAIEFPNLTIEQVRRVLDPKYAGAPREER